VLRRSVRSISILRKLLPPLAAADKGPEEEYEQCTQYRDGRDQELMSERRTPHHPHVDFVDSEHLAMVRAR
jgi:hypothetical protein